MFKCKLSILILVLFFSFTVCAQGNFTADFMVRYEINGEKKVYKKTETLTDKNAEDTEYVFNFLIKEITPDSDLQKRISSKTGETADKIKILDRRVKAKYTDGSWFVETLDGSYYGYNAEKDEHFNYTAGKDRAYHYDIDVKYYFQGMSYPEETCISIRSNEKYELFVKNVRRGKYNYKLKKAIARKFGYTVNSIKIYSAQAVGCRSLTDTRAYYYDIEVKYYFMGMSYPEETLISISSHEKYEDFLKSFEKGKYKSKIKKALGKELGCSPDAVKIYSAQPIGC